MNRPWGAYTPDRWQKLLINLCRHTPLGRGKARRFIRDKLLSRKTGTIDYEFPCANIRIELTGNACEWKFLLNPAYNRQELLFVRRSLHETKQDQRVFVDIGANFGLYSLYMYQHADIILAIEPLADIRERLEYNISVNRQYDRTRIIPCAISDRERELGFCHDDNDLGGSHVSEDRSGSSCTVQAKTLEAVLQEQGIKNITCIKIDIEGHEDRALLPFLQHADPCLHPEAIVIEHLSRHEWKSDCIDYLLNSNYRIIHKTTNNTLLKLK